MQIVETVLARKAKSYSLPYPHSGGVRQISTKENDT